MVAHSVPHGNVACELFYPSGPLALLPMTDHSDGRPRSAIVWTVKAENAAGARKLGPKALAAEIAARVDGTLGDIEVIARQAVWPLGYHHAESYTAERLLLIGDAAHGIHPIAGQGLNMGFRDVAALTEVLTEAVRTGQDLGSPAVLGRYSSWRRLDNMMVGAVTDGLHRLFGLRRPASRRCPPLRAGRGGAHRPAEKALHGRSAWRDGQAAGAAAGRAGLGRKQPGGECLPLFRQHGVDIERCAAGGFHDFAPDGGNQKRADDAQRHGARVAGAHFAACLRRGDGRGQRRKRRADDIVMPLPGEIGEVARFGNDDAGEPAQFGLANGAREPFEQGIEQLRKGQVGGGKARQQCHLKRSAGRDDRGKQIGLGREIDEQRGLRDAGAGGDVGHPGAGKTLFGKGLPEPPR